MTLTTLNLSGIKAGDSLNISVSQGGLTAGPYSVGSWGGGGGGGTVTITTSRTNLQVAPDSVRFWVDLDSSDFDTSGPGVGEFYDPRMHELIFLWDFDDPGNWTAPEKGLPAWKNRNVGKGPFVAHMYQAAGTYNPTVLVIEPSSGKTATATVEIVVNDPDTVNVNTWVINRVGDTDWTGAPAGATQINANSVTEANFSFGTTPNRILFKGGETFDCSIDFSAVGGEVTVGAYGTGKATLNGPNKDGVAANGIFYWTGAYSVFENQPNDIRFFNLKLEDTFDPAVAADWSDDFATGIRSQAGSESLILSNVEIRGIKNVLVSVDGPAGLTTHMHLDNCIVTDFGGPQYQVYTGGSVAADSTFACTGTVIASKADAVAYLGSARSPIRAAAVPNCYVAGCDGYMTEPSAMHYRLCGSPVSDGSLINVHSNATEGGDGAVVLDANVTQAGGGRIGRSTVGNRIIDGNIHVGNWSTRRFVDTSGTGVTIRNNLFIQPNMVYVNSPPLEGFIRIRDSVAGGAYDATVYNAPIRVYNNTFVNLRTTAKNTTGSGTVYTPPIFDRKDLNGFGFQVVEEYNNIVHCPNEDTPRTSFAPLLDSGAELWTVRNPGWRDPSDGVLKTTDPYPDAAGSAATPAGTVQPFSPVTGSAAIGAALTNEIAYDSLGGFGTARDDPASQGAWEPA